MKNMLHDSSLTSKMNCTCFCIASDTHFVVSRQLSKMKKLYMLSSGDYFLSSEVLLRLELLHGDQWNIRHLSQIQPEVVKPLLLYWYEKMNMFRSIVYKFSLSFDKPIRFISCHLSHCNYGKQCNCKYQQMSPLNFQFSLK